MVVWGRGIGLSLIVVDQRRVVDALFSRQRGHSGVFEYVRSLTKSHLGGCAKTPERVCKFDQNGCAKTSRIATYSWPIMKHYRCTLEGTRIENRRSRNLDVA
jgi:hypothetical protein